ncbi:MAG: hypothetical protein KBD47_02075 [Candidatus Pacebacteria bacterium]|jgi:hypothetical protein|nr:hypothetical protein [Candidatus Paceibacterota bacterium]
MLVTQPISKIIERVVTARNGQLMRVTFLVSEIAGAIQVKVLSATPIVALTSVCLAISGNVQNIVNRFSVNFSEFTSGFSDFAFFMSQPTRAPAFI